MASFEPDRSVGPGAALGASPGVTISFQSRPLEVNQSAVVRSSSDDPRTRTPFPTATMSTGSVVDHGAATGSNRLPSHMSHRVVVEPTIAQIGDEVPTRSRPTPSIVHTTESSRSTSSNCRLCGTRRMENRFTGSSWKSPEASAIDSLPNVTFTRYAPPIPAIWSHGTRTSLTASRNARPPSMIGYPSAGSAATASVTRKPCGAARPAASMSTGTSPVSVTRKSRRCPLTIADRPAGIRNATFARRTGG